MHLDPNAVTWQEVDGEIVAIDIARSEYFTVNDSAKVLWEALTTGADHDALANALVVTYDIPLSEARADAAEFVALLKGRQFLTES